ncbi:MAG: GGDEF domain-containing protein [bacterium]
MKEKDIMEENLKLRMDLQRLKKNIFIDELTDLFNHRYLNTRLKEEMKRSKRYTLFLSLVFVEIEKIINEGKVDDIKKIGEFIKCNIRDADIISIFDKNIFALILPETNIEGANVLSERLREQILLFGYNKKGDKNYTTGQRINIGITSYPTDAGGFEELISKSLNMLKLSRESEENTICSSYTV